MTLFHVFPFLIFPPSTAPPHCISGISLSSDLPPIRFLKGIPIPPPTFFCCLQSLPFSLAAFPKFSCFAQGSSLDLKILKQLFLLSSQLIVNASPQLFFHIAVAITLDSFHICKYYQDDTMKNLNTL